MQIPYITPENARGLQFLQPLQIAMSRDTMSKLTELGMEHGIPEPPDDKPELVAAKLLSMSVKWYYDGMPLAGRPLDCGPLLPDYSVKTTKPIVKVMGIVMEMHSRAMNDDANMKRLDSIADVARPILHSFAGAIASGSSCAVTVFGHYLDAPGQNNWEHLWGPNVHGQCGEYPTKQ